MDVFKHKQFLAIYLRDIPYPMSYQMDQYWNSFVNTGYRYIYSTQWQNLNIWALAEYIHSKLYLNFSELHYD